MDLSPGWLISSFLLSSVGFGLFLYGKKQLRIPQLMVGIAFMVYPMFVASPAWMLSIGVVLTLGLWLTVRAGA